MGHFSYCFCLTLLHSLWQAGLLFSAYGGFNVVASRTQPAAKRNVLYLLLLGQLLISISTFVIYYTGSLSFYSEIITANFYGIISNQSYLEQIAPWFLSLYMLVLLLKSGRLLYNWKMFRSRSKLNWIKPPVDIKLFGILKAHEFGIRRKVTIWYSHTVQTPLTFGFLKPVILLPVALVNNLSVKETESLIIHELTHIRNHDYLFNWLLIGCETMFFFNPFIRLMANRIKLEREKNCDTQVLHFNYPPIHYAETLLKAARFKTNAAPFFLAAVRKNAQLLNRIQFFTEENNLRFHKKNYTSLAMLPVLLLLIVNVYLVNIARQKNAEVLIPTQLLLNDNTIAEVAAPVSTDIYPANTDVSEQPTNSSGQTYVPSDEIEGAPVTVEEPILEETPATTFAMPVALTEESKEESKEVTLTEENSETGVSITKVYNVKLVNGEWKASLQWMITEKKLLLDSLRKVKDSLIHPYDLVQ